MDNRLNPIGMQSSGFTKNVKSLKESLQELDKIEDLADLSNSSSSDLKKLQKELDSLADAANNMKKDIAAKYKDTLNPKPKSSSGSNK